MNLNGMSVYLSGPLARRADWLYDEVECKAKELGALRVFNPSKSCGMHQGRDHAQYARYRLHELTRGDLARDETEYDVLLLIEGWRTSSVCLAEVVAAHSIGCEVVESWEL